MTLGEKGREGSENVVILYYLENEMMKDSYVKSKKISLLFLQHQPVICLCLITDQRNYTLW